MARDETDARQMPEGIERFDWRSILNVADDTTPDVIAALNQYFAPFARITFEAERAEDGKPVMDDQPCINCGKPLLGGVSSFWNGGGFKWGLVHGEGQCSECGWPARMYHFIKDAAGDDLVTLRNILLQYHPDFVEAPAPSLSTSGAA